MHGCFSIYYTCFSEWLANSLGIIIDQYIDNFTFSLQFPLLANFVLVIKTCVFLLPFFSFKILFAGLYLMVMKWIS